MTPYYDDGAGIVIYHGDARDILPRISATVVVTDPPYGIGYESGQYGTLPRSIEGDKDTSLRDWALATAGLPALVFGSWRVAAPKGTRAMLVWDQGPALGMGALDLPWKPSWQAVYVIGSGFRGRRDGAVLRYPPVQSMARNGRVHPHEKPMELMSSLLAKCPTGLVLDPFAGSGSTLVAAKAMGITAWGIEIEERYCEIAAKRLAQGVLDFNGTDPARPTVDVAAPMLGGDE